MRTILRANNPKTLLQPPVNRTLSANRILPAMSPSPPSPFAGLPVVPPNDPSLHTTAPTPRAIDDVFLAREQSEGAGARVRRSIGSSHLRHLSPFLMLDHFRIPPGSGFPDHPHRGQETITYLLHGAVDHEDFAGNKGTIWAGDLQFMTAGRGIVHAEMPHVDPAADPDPITGLQLWVDLPRALKACAPRYRDLRAHEIPLAGAAADGASVKVISGRSLGVDSVRELAYTPVWLLDVTVAAGGRLAQRVPRGWNAFAYVLAGRAGFETGATTRTVADAYHTAVFSRHGDQVVASVPAEAEESARFVLVAGMPLDQPIVQYGPFVLTDESEVKQALMDYSSFQNGFERAQGWESEIGRSMA